MKREAFALSVVLLVLVAFPASLFAYQSWRTSAPGVQVITLIGNAPVNGGWQPDTIRVNLGERVRLRITSNDMVHGFAVPALGLQVDEILPGHVEEVEFVASQAGRFPFTCTRWCSVDHWRMRGVIEVVDPANPGALMPMAGAQALYQQLHLNLDALHPAQRVPLQRPSAAGGAELNIAPPDYLQDRDYLRRHAPSDLYAQLRSDSSFKSLLDQQLWDLYAFAYERAAGAEAIKRGQQIYSRDCAACHGELGKGNGPAGVNLPGLAMMHPEMKRGPADFTDASQMLGAPDVLLQGKIFRGGMGTGMPEWGSLYSEQDMSDVISFIRSFVFQYDTSHP
jgi:mono/diheme cytochrome c family protein